MKNHQIHYAPCDSGVMLNFVFAKEDGEQTHENVAFLTCDEIATLQDWAAAAEAPEPARMRVEGGFAVWHQAGPVIYTTALSDHFKSGDFLVQLSLRI